MSGVDVTPGIGPFEVTGGPEVSRYGRHLLPLGADGPSRDGAPVADRTSRPGPRGKRARCRSRRQPFYERLPDVRKHLICRVVELLEPITQKHDIEGLVMG